jgi:hypothetical protein
MSAFDPKQTFSIALLQGNTGRKSPEPPLFGGQENCVPPSTAIIIGPNTVWLGWGHQCRNALFPASP